VVGAAHALVDHVLHAHGRVVPAHVHADLQEHGDDAGVLADRAVAFGAHARVDQDLRHRVLGRGRFLALPGGGEVADVVDRVVVADVLQRVGDGLDQVLLADGHRDVRRAGRSGSGHGWLMAGGKPAHFRPKWRRGRGPCHTGKRCSVLESMEPVDHFHRHQPRLLALAYRLLGSRADAEDVVQDAWLRGHRADRAAIADPEAWLVTTATRLGIDRLRAARRRRETYPGPWLPEPARVDP